MLYLLLSAATQSEWDTCSFALIPINEIELDRWKKVDAHRISGKDIGVFTTSLNEDAASFYSDDSELPDTCFDDANQIKEGIYELADELVEGLSVPENAIKYGEIVFSEYTVTFKAQGKHTGEEFWCNHPLSLIEDHLNEITKALTA